MMKRLFPILMLMALLATFFAVPAAAQSQSTRYIVVLTGTGTPANPSQMAVAMGGALERAFPEIGVLIVSSSDPDFALTARRARGVFAVGVERTQGLSDSGLAEVAADDVPVGATAGGTSGVGPTPADKLYGSQWNIRRVGADVAWNTTAGSHNTVVAVIDTGVAWNHPDLASNVVFKACYATVPCNPYPSLHGHGTLVAGIVAAAFGGGRIVGVGPQLGIASYNVFERIGGNVLATDGAIWSAMLDTAAQGFDVINLSLGGYLLSPNSQQDLAAWTAWKRVTNYVIQQGVTVVASAGNSALDHNGPGETIPGDLPGVINVGATGIGPAPAFPQVGFFDRLAFYSDFGSAVDITAPGGDCGTPSTCPLDSLPTFKVVSASVVFSPSGCAATASCLVSYAFVRGTSMAAPHVSAAAGLLHELDSGLNPHQILAILIQTANSLGDRQIFGHGLLDVAEAVSVP